MRGWLALALILPLVAAAQTPGFGEGRGERSRKGEAQVSPPPYPKPENYLPFQVNTAVSFEFFVDAKSISVSADGVIRYTVIAKSSAGALNISFEGMRCAERTFRVYAFGRTGNTWLEVRNSRWEPILGEARSAQRAVLYRDFFCPMTGNIVTAEQGVRALKDGGGARPATMGY